MALVTFCTSSIARVMCSGGQVLKAKTCHNLEPTISAPNSRPNCPTLHSTIITQNWSWKFVHCRVVCLQTLHFVSNFLHCVHDAGEKRGKFDFARIFTSRKTPNKPQPTCKQTLSMGFWKNTTHTHTRVLTPAHTHLDSGIHSPETDYVPAHVCSCFFPGKMFQKHCSHSWCASAFADDMKLSLYTTLVHRKRVF